MQCNFFALRNREIQEEKLLPQRRQSIFLYVRQLRPNKIERKSVLAERPEANLIHAQFVNQLFLEELIGATSYHVPLLRWSLLELVLLR